MLKEVNQRYTKKANKNTYLFEPFTSHSVLHAGDPTRRSGVALQVGIGERRGGGGRAKSRKAQAPTRGGISLKMF